MNTVHVETVLGSWGEESNTKKIKQYNLIMNRQHLLFHVSVKLLTYSAKLRKQMLSLCLIGGCATDSSVAPVLSESPELIQ